MVDILLTHSYHLYYDRKQARKMQPYPPLGTLYAAALLRERGFTVELFDSMLEDPEQGFWNAVTRARPRIVAIYEDNFNFLSKMCLSRMRAVAFAMIDVARAHDATIVVNGSDASDHSTEYLQRGAHYVLLGESEWTLLELADSLFRGGERPAADIPGLTFAAGARGTITRTPARALMKSLDQLPVPARDLIDMSRYSKAWKEAHGFFSLNLTASRGCPYRCNWCAKPIYGNSFNVRSPESVALEMLELRERFGADLLWFADDLFGIQSQWVQEFANAVEKWDARVPFKMQSRVDLMKEETVRALRRSGCVEVWMGVESGSQKILDAMEKGTAVGQIVSARQKLKEHGIRASYFLQFGYPGETWADIQKTIQLVRETRPDDVGVSVSYPLPGTSFHERVCEELGAKTNWEDSEDLAMMFKGAYASEFYRALHDALHLEVESWGQSHDWKFAISDPSRAGFRTDPARLHQLWSEVERLEQTCRNSDATLVFSRGGR
jgi:radical SAM superfamily enzyme YgiQ (UPF0313 family)